jgi:hypothetical protein
MGIPTNIKNVFLAGATVATLATGFNAAPANACGLIGCIVDQVLPGVGTQLDIINRNLGQPVDHIAAIVADIYVPGSGQAMEYYWAAQQAGLFDGSIDDFVNLSPEDLTEIVSQLADDD